jgi:hypothetical protein
MWANSIQEELLFQFGFVRIVPPGTAARPKEKFGATPHMKQGDAQTNGQPLE